MGEAIQLIGFFESKGVGINWSNLNDTVSVNDSLTFLQLLLISLSTNIIHLLLFYYFEQINPGDNGIARRWYFPIEKLIDRIRNKNVNKLDMSFTNKAYEKRDNEQHTIDTTTDSDDVFIENDQIYATTRRAGIQINNITKQFKQFGKLKTAVNNLSLKIYENHITCLLGHNGAGKSTTISMITGITSPSQGEILINDHNIVTNTRMARKQIGYCPQYNLLFDEMTVGEHLKFFAKLKENYDPNEITSILEDLNIKDKVNSLSKTLSGGMKRKLCVAIAFIGSSKIVILDEPTSGMDPQARHATWTVLQKFKQEKQCSILLTTHFMDEADFLGDRIAIMSRGNLKCCGSPLYLKSKFDSGYNLVINRKCNDDNDSDELVTNFTNLVQKHVTNAKLNSNINNEITFVLPKEEAFKFSQLFNELELVKNDLNIINIGVTVTTIEEVFLKIGDLEDAEEEEEEKEIKVNNVKNVDDYGLFVGLNKQHDLYENPIEKYFYQFKGLFIKKFIHSLRNKILVISQLIVPVATLFMILILVKYGPIQLSDSVPLNISFDNYPLNYIPFKINNNSIISNIYANKFKNSLNLNEASKLTNCSDSTSNIDNYLICIGNLPDTGLSLLTDNYLVGTTFTSDNKIIGHFNNQPYHVAPLTLNLITNILFQFLTNLTHDDVKINVINHPMPRTPDEQINDIQKLGVVGGFQIASTVTFGYSFLIASFTLFLIKERISNAKHMQYLTGAQPVLFWLSNLVWDLINYLIPAFICVILIVAFGIDNYTGNQLKYIIGLFLLYGFAHIPQTYLISYLFQSSSTGFAINVAWNILSSQIPIVGVYFLQLPALGLTNEGDILEWIFLIFLPNFAFGQGLTDVYTNYEYNNYCGKNNVSSELTCKYRPNPCCIKYKNCGIGVECIKWTEDYMSWEKPGVGRYFLFMIVQFIVMFSFVIFYELGYLRKVIYMIKSMFGLRKTNNNNKTNDLTSEQKNIEELFGDIQKDQDVILEEKRIDSNKNDLLCIDNLTKYYSNFMAVKGISLGIKKGECFGLLG